MNELIFTNDSVDDNYYIKLMAMYDDQDADITYKEILLQEKYTSYNHIFTIYGLGDLIENYCKRISDPREWDTIYMPGDYYRIIIASGNNEVYRQDLFIFPSSEDIEYSKMHNRLMYSMLPETRATTLNSDEFFHITTGDNPHIEVTGYRDMRLDDDNSYIYDKDYIINKVGHYTIIPEDSNDVTRIDVSAREILKRFSTRPHYYVVRAYVNNQLRKETTYVITEHRRLHNFAFRNIYGAIETLRASEVNRTDIVDSEIMSAGYKEYRIVKGIPDVYNVKTGAIQTIEEFRMWRSLLRGQYTWYKIKGEYYPIVITEIEENPISMGNDAERNFTFKFRMANKTDNYKL